VKITVTAALISTLIFFSAASSQSEDHYIYRDAQGKLVISNQQPPPGSNILRKFDLPAFRDTQTQYVQEISTIRSTGQLEGLPKQEQKK
jgi:hypothetical protein